MPSKKPYDLVPNDENDLRIPMHSEETFRHGISYHAKYIGSLDIPKPTSRLEIVAAMRRIRYEFKAKGVKKKNVSLEISLDGVKVSLRRKKKKKEWPIEDASMLLMHHPVYRIFYVSHDSQDMKIFSYIARDGSSNVFRCNVFKTNKKSQAMRIVRTVGQAFEVCNKIPQSSLEEETADDLSSDEHSSKKDVASELGADQSQDDATSSLPDSPKNAEQYERPVKLDLEKPPALFNEEVKVAEVRQQLQQPQQQQQPQQPQQQSSVPAQPYQQQPMNQTLNRVTPTTPLALQHEVLLLKQQLEQQQQQTQAALAQVKLLKDQLAAETAARLEAQTRTHQLLVHNKELLDHIQTLVIQVQDLEGKVQSGNAGLQQGSAPPLAQMSGLPTLREVDCIDESNPADLYSTTVALQQQLQQQQQQYSMLLAQAAHQQQQNLLPQLLLANLNAAALFPFQSPSTPRFPSPNSSFTSLTPNPAHYGSTPSGCPFILPLAEADKSGSHDSGLGSGQLAAGAGAGAGQNRPLDVIRRLQLIGEDSNASLQSCDSDRMRMDSSSMESMSNGSKPSLPTLHQQLENLRLGYDGGEERGTLRRNGPFITRSTSEKVPHRNEILAQVQRTAWARHTTK